MRRPAADEGPDRRQRLKAAWVLMLLTLVCAELTFLGVGIPYLWVMFPLLFPMYGAGVLLVREVVVRAGGGWPSLIIMAVVYELIEDGIGLQALTSPVLYAAPEWGPRVLGVNLTYWQAQIGYHVVFSVLIPIMITDLIFPRLRAAPYLRRPGVIISAVAAVIGVALVRVGISGTEDPGYRTPWPYLVCLVLIIAVLSHLALRVLPRRRSATTCERVTSDDADDAVPAPAGIGLAAFAATLIFLFLLMPREDPASGPAVGEGWPVVLAMITAAGLMAGTVVLLRRWTAGTRWTDSHRISSAGGALVGHTLFMVIVTMLHPGDPVTNRLALIGGPTMIIVMIVALARLAQVVGDRAREGVPIADQAGSGSQRRMSPG